MTVAIIVRAKNEMPYARRTLEMLRRQTFADFEIYAVDSGSTDGTLEVLPRPEQIRPEEYVPGKVLNSAIAKTAHRIIVLLNADAVPQSDDWLEKLIRPITDGKADATFSRQTARPDAKFIVAYDYERAYAPQNIQPGFFSAVACAFRRELWEQHRFIETRYAEDTAWAKTCIASGARFQLSGNSVVEHSHNYSIQELFQKRYRQALTLKNTPAFGILLREIIRDLLHAFSKFRIGTVPYNIIYRITIFRAQRKGAKAT